MLGKPHRARVDGPPSSPPRILHFFPVLSKNTQALTPTLQPGCGQLRKELSFRWGLHLGVTPSPPKEKEAPEHTA